MRSCNPAVTSQEFAQTKPSHPFKYLFKDIHGLSLSPKKPGLGPKHVFQKLPQISFKDNDDFDDITGIDNVATQRKLVSSPELKPKADPHQGERNQSISARAGKPEVKPQPKVAAPQAKTPKPPAKANQSVKMEELRKHCFPEDAWTAIRGEVFDITEYIKRHPGGQSAIKKILGQDGTRLFGRDCSR